MSLKTSQRERERERKGAILWLINLVVLKEIKGAGRARERERKRKCEKIEGKINKREHKPSTNRIITIIKIKGVRVKKQNAFFLNKLYPSKRALDKSELPAGMMTPP